MAIGMKTNVKLGAGAEGLSHSRAEIKVPFISLAHTVRASGSADQDALNRVGIETEKYCPLSKLFRVAGTKLEVIWLPA